MCFGARADVRAISTQVYARIELNGSLEIRAAVRLHADATGPHGARRGALDANGAGAGGGASGAATSSASQDAREGTARLVLVPCSAVC